VIVTMAWAARWWGWLGLVAAIALGCGGGEGESAAPLLTVEVPAGFAEGPLAALAPVENPLTEARARLGKRLFFDPRLSRTGDVSCSSCHKQENAFADPRRVSVGVQGRMRKRNAPALVNLAWSESFFWDGRSPTLEDQTGKPIEDPNEMDLPLAEAVARVNADPGYVTDFGAAFAGPPTELRLRQALASFMRVLVSGQSAYDRYLRGDAGALSAAARRGEALFFEEAGGCFHCHPPKVLTNEGFFNNGSFDEGGDPGRQALTGRSGDLGKFKVPGLRNIAVTAPYMHDGSVATLEDVIEQYAKGGRGHPATDPQITPLSLSAADKADLVAFLRALTDERFLVDPRYRP
jgi:cytochrome c peroxidase